MSWVVYMVKCADDSLYTGITTDTERRVREHNECDKKSAKYTRARRPVTLVYVEPCQDRSTASRREARLKRLSRLQKLAVINS